MGLFDRLFGKKEEPKIEDVVKEALENLDLSEEVEESQAAVEETATDKVEETPAQEEIPQISTEEVIEPEAVEETAQEELEL